MSLSAVGSANTNARSSRISSSQEVSISSLVIVYRCKLKPSDVPFPADGTRPLHLGSLAFRSYLLI
ncbi:2187_t:CDS:2 [Acaulospora colombiana]|uniref:2187_t:CDS:1 n=1 Tax=Acaulospora colombiana TaxID=27376 RepID=A0ACA9P6Q2_9GLOM|nr:2187_t:CDS:2 [Acaulospora colombiana]